MNPNEFDSLYNNIIASIQKDVEDGDFEILEQTDHSICVWDNLDIIDREYTITNPNKIDRAFLENRIVFTPSLATLPFCLQKENLLRLLESADKRLFMTLNNIVFCNDIEEDYDYLSQLNEDYAQELEVSDLPEQGTLGIHWYCYNKVLINVGAIFQETIQMAKDGDIYPYEIHNCLEWGIITTLFHELRHLEQANPYLPEELFKIEDKEEDAEIYARTFADTCSISIISNFSPEYSELYEEKEELYDH